MSEIGCCARLMILFIVANAWAQDANSSHFELVSIKPIDHRVPLGYTGGPGSSDPGRITYSRVSVRRLIADAYSEEYGDRIIGPRSLDSEYTVTATLPKGTTRAQLVLMLRNMLGERFGLAFHAVSKDVSGFELRIAAGGPKLTPLVEDPTPTQQDGIPPVKLDATGFPRVAEPTTWQGAVSDGLERVTFKGCTMPQLAYALRRIYTHNTIPVVDKTGMAGKFDFKVELPAPEETRPERAGDSVVGAGPSGAGAVLNSVSGPLQRQLGLTLRAEKLQQSFLVVDHILPKPVEN